jgi:NADH-quinone oxidoreductase subunit J
VTVGAAAFYALAALVAGATALAVTRREPVHAVGWLVVSVLGTALLFALLGAPLLAALEVIVYAGGILVLFLFVILMLKGEPRSPPLSGVRRALRWGLPLAAFCLLAGTAGVLVAADPEGRTVLALAQVSPREFGTFLFARHAVSVEVASTLLFVALVGALYLGRRERTEPPEKP